MVKRIKIGWDISHMEFTIEDHYYFSVLKKSIREAGAVVRELDSLGDIANFDVLVINYPEKPFKKTEAKLVRDFLKSGKKVIVGGYYKNEDRIADHINSLSSHFGLLLNKDEVRDRFSNDEGDDLLIVTSRVLSYNDSVERVLLPCSASISILDSSARPIIYKEKSGSRRERVLGAESRIDGGRFLLLGTCVFWDNFAIKKYSNFRFSLNLLLD